MKDADPGSALYLDWRSSRGTRSNAESMISQTWGENRYNSTTESLDPDISVLNVSNLSLFSRDNRKGLILTSALIWMQLKWDSSLD